MKRISVLLPDHSHSVTLWLCDFGDGAVCLTVCANYTQHLLVLCRGWLKSPWCHFLLPLHLWIWTWETRWLDLTSRPVPTLFFSSGIFCSTLKMNTRSFTWDSANISYQIRVEEAFKRFPACVLDFLAPFKGWINQVHFLQSALMSEGMCPSRWRWTEGTWDKAPWRSRYAKLMLFLLELTVNT